MSNLLTVVLAIFIVAQFQGIKCNPLHVEKEIGDVQRNERVFKPDKKEWMHFHHSWGLPHFPSLTSVSNFFQDEEEKDRIATKNRLEALEKNQKEILAILQKLNDEISTKKNQTKPQPLDEEPQTSTQDDRKPTSPAPSNKEITTRKIEIENVSSTPTVPSTVFTTVASTISSSASSMASSTTVTRAPATETSTVQVTTQQPQSSTSSEESQPQTPDQNENTNSNSNSNTPDNQATTDSAGQQSSPPPDTNSGSIVAFSSDESENSTEMAQSTA